jgi:transposase InsO family protein
MALDGFSRFVLDWELMTDMTSRSVQEFLQRVRERYPEGKPMLIHDNGSAFISRDFKMLVSRLDIQQVFTRRNHPQTNGKAERWNGVMRQEALRPAAPGSFEEACLVIGRFVEVYNHQRLHAGIKFLRPADLFYGRAEQVLARRVERFAAARQQRARLNKQRREADYSLTVQ